MKPRILLAGAGETGLELAQRLHKHWAITIIDPDGDALAALAERPWTAEITTHAGDATSALVLRKTGIDGVHAAVACTGSDEVNLEFLRVARSVFEVHNRFGLMYGLDWEQRYRDEGVEIISQDQACAAILEARVQRGQRVATAVGLGEGEIIEVEVLANSSVIGRTLAELRPRRWLVGAVYRDGTLIVPHGDTVLEQGDRVLLIGDTEILASIATLIRTGESEFPLQYGSHVMTIFQDGLEPDLDEVAYLLEHTRAARLETIACHADEGRLSELAARLDAKGIPREFSCTASSRSESLAAESEDRDVGVLALPGERLSFLSRIGLGRSRTARIIDQVSSPVLITRGSFPYRRVLLALTELPFNMAAAQLAIDAARMVQAELCLGVFHQPDIVVGSEMRAEVEQRAREVENLAGLFHIKIERLSTEGNPIHETLAAAHDHDLVVLPYTRGRSSFLTRPDVGLNLIHRLERSVLVMPC